MALLVCLWYRVPQPSRWKLVLAANAVFCLSIDIGAFFAVALATAVVWQAAQHAQPEQPSRRGWLALGLAAALLPLLVLKYSGMLVPGLRDLYKPFGLAYYSLQLAGYLLDVWHGRTAPTPSYARLWCYAGFFLSLTQGPFNRYNTLMPQLEAAPKTFETQRLVSGLQRSAWGYFKKFAIADRAAIVVSAAFADPASFDRSQLIFATVMYSFQLYADFSGYTDIVLGMGEDPGPASAGKLPPAVFFCQRQGAVGPVAYQPFAVVPGLCVYPTGRQPQGHCRRDANPAADLFGQPGCGTAPTGPSLSGVGARPVPGGGGSTMPSRCASANLCCCASWACR